ncbi:hypothetical protein F975_01643 [Acinetobacter sp. ANC 3789]|uniref:hypothetical protein n=1 Tax=Acinetobacter sp. ANC 3789 TaxID=1217714 RepID=UPI0002CE85AC|nr:hypothetical protein [Acinetobacter sp. ANC 3789]ENU80589.1 hypothetical protein F975_01643 [Acinetobacter sp. ANC 3789]
MYSPQPHGLVVEGGGKLTAQDSLYVDAVVRRFLNFKRVSELESMRRYYDLPNGGRFIVQYMGGIFKVIIYKNPSDTDEKLDEIIKLDIPMLFCGSINNELVNGNKVSLKISSLTRKRLVHYSDDAELPKQQIELNRFNIGINKDIVPEFERASIQYQLQRPTWYSGAMAEVMQIVGGYGKQPKKTNFKDKTLEDIQMFLPNSILNDIKKELNGVRMPAYKGFPIASGKYQYDYKFSKTHAVGFDTDESPWLLQVSKDGLYAMPFPIIPATATKAFKHYIFDKGDTELITILDRFGALPSGESFPTDEKEFEAWRRAGVIIRLCDTDDFYKNSAYSDACGWSFNKQGSECFNTCYNIEDGYKVGYSYHINISLKPTLSKFGWAEQVTITGDDVAKVSEYLNNLQAALYLLKDDSIQAKPIFYKLRASLDIVIERANLEIISVDNEITFWNDLELQPIANHVADITMVDKGFLYYDYSIDFYGSTAIRIPRISDGNNSLYGSDYVEYGNNYSHENSSALIAFPDPSDSNVPFKYFDFSGPTGSDKRKNCNTIMYGYYVGNTLKVIRYAVDWSLFQKPVAWPIPDMVEGYTKLHIPFEKTTTYGWSYQVGLFYTTDFDFRSIQPQFEKICNLVPGEIQLVVSDGFNKRYQFKPKLYITSHQSFSQASTILIPYFDRNSFVHQKMERERGESIGYITATQEMSDRYTYSFRTVGNKAVVSGLGDSGNKNYTSGGPLAEVGDEVELVPYTMDGYKPPTSDYKNVPISATYSPKKYTVRGDTLGVASQIAYKEGDSGDIFENENGKYYVDSCRVVFGTKSYASIRLGKSSNVFKSQDVTAFSADNTNQQFIGVINE